MGRIDGSLVFPYVCLFLMYAGCRAEGASSYGLDSAISQADTDPLGSVDVFPTLPPSLKAVLSQLAHHNLAEKQSSLLSLQTTNRVSVFLVGFSVTDAGHLRRYLEALNQDIHTKVMGHEPHQLLIGTKIAFDLEIRNDLSLQIFSALSEYVQPMAVTTTQALMPVPHTLVDDIVASYQNTHETDSYQVYLLNLKPQARRYAYTYNNTKEQLYLKCLGTHWTGSGRYMWIDLAAGPVEYGPSAAGEGFVKGALLPHSSSYSPLQRQTAFLSDVASALWSAARMLLVPAIRTPVQFEQQTEVHFYHIQGSDLDLLNWDEDEGNTTEVETVKSTKGLQWEKIQGTFQGESKDNVLLPGQTLKFLRYGLQFSNCPLCGSVFTRSLKSYTSRILLERFSLFVHEYLDSKQLHVLLSEYSGEIAEQAGVPEVTKEPQPRIVPVYIFDIDSDKQLTLDRFHQVIPFKDMVIAVRSKSGQMMSDYSCNGRPSIAQTRELNRPLVAALLQTVWGVAPTHLSWSAQHNSTFVDYRWAVGQTPFGPFSDLLSLSFAQTDPARRNVLFTMLNSSVTTALDVLGAIETQGGEKNLFSHPKKLQEYTQRWNLYVYKLSKAVSALSHFDFNSAVFFLKSSEHDMYAVHSLVHTSSLDLEASIECFKDPPFPWIWLVSLSGVFLVVVYLWIRRDQIFVNKRKVF